MGSPDDPAAPPPPPASHDPDRGVDGTGRYRLAIAHKLKGLAGPQLAEAWAYAQTPLGGYRPVPQARKFHRSTKRFRFTLGGNRSSKSHSLAVETMYRLTGMHPWRPGAKVPTVGWYATTTWDKVGDTLWAKLDPDQGGLLKGLPHRWEVVWHNKQRAIPEFLTVHTPAGPSRCAFKAFEQGRESFQATDLDWAHFDEQFGEDIFTETVTRIGPTRSMDFAAAFTPLIPQEWLEHRTAIEPRASDDVFYYPLDDNRISGGGFIPDELIDATIENWAPEVRETRRRGRWGSYQGAIFQTFDRGVHVVDAERERRVVFRGERVPYGVHAVGSIDWGGNNPFVFLWAVRVPHLDDDWYVFDEYYWNFQERGPRRLEEHAAEIKARTERWGTVLARTWADHDPTDAREMAHYGVPSSPTDKADKLAGIESLQTLLAPRPHLANADWPGGRPRLTIAARCANLVRELPAYRWKVGTDRQDAPREPVKVHDHAVDAVRYLVHSERAGRPDRKPAKATPTAGMFRRQF